MIAPTLHTERLTLRPYRLDDFDAYAALMTSERAKYMQAGLDRKGAWNWFTADVAHWPLFGFGSLMIDVDARGETVGAVGLNKGISFPETELGWQLYDGFEGHGYATEAGRAVLAYAFTRLGAERAISLIRTENTESERVARRLGGRQSTTIDFLGSATLVYNYHRPDGPN
jgi:RimJ/RimL family protein N-acetyltransferase